MKRIFLLPILIIILLAGTSAVVFRFYPQLSYTIYNNSKSKQTTPHPTTQTTTFPVGLIVNGSSVGQIQMQEGQNQCDVLTNALSQGKIVSLDMRYDKSMKTYGVYRINGIGKANSVWWVYTINGQSPTQGCNYIKTHKNDSITWSYLGK